MDRGATGEEQGMGAQFPNELMHLKTWRCVSSAKYLFLKFPTSKEVRCS